MSYTNLNNVVYTVDQIVNEYKKCWSGTLECDYDTGIIIFGDKIGYIGDKKQYTKTLISDLISEENDKFGWFVLNRRHTQITSSSLGTKQFLIKKFIWEK